MADRDDALLTMERMRIGDLAKRLGITPRTVRYYESLGLIPPGEREGTGQHYYSEETVARLAKIDQLKSLGLSLEEIGEVLEFYFQQPDMGVPKRKVIAILRRHLEETDSKMAALGSFRAELEANIEKFESWLRERDL